MKYILILVLILIASCSKKDQKEVALSNVSYEKFSLNEDSIKQFTLPVSVNNNTAKVSIVNFPLNGELSCDQLECTFTPNENYYGVDTFTVSITDEANKEQIKEYRLEVLPINDPPESQDISFNIQEDKNLTFELIKLDHDTKFEDIEIDWIDSPDGAFGRIQCQDHNCELILNENYDESFTLRYKLSDGEFDSQEHQVSFNMQPVNDAPSLSEDLNVLAIKDTVRNFNIPSLVDPEGDDANWYIYSAPRNGTLACSGNNCNYVPNPTFSGDDFFVIDLIDNLGAKKRQVIEVFVDSGNEPPVVPYFQNISAIEDIPIRFDIASGADPEGSLLNYYFSSLSDNGNVSCDFSSLSCLFTPHQDFNGSTTFSYIVRDDFAQESVTSVVLDFAPVNDPPEYSGDISFTSNEDEDLIFNLPSFSDVDGDNINIVQSSNPSNGILICEISNGEICTFRPNSNFYGQDSFSLNYSDGASSHSIEINFDIQNVVDTPRFADLNISLTTLEDNQKSFIIPEATSPESESILYSISRVPVNGNLICTERSCTYTPSENYNGPDSFEVSSEVLGTVGDKINYVVNVTPVEDAPSVIVESITTNEDEVLSFRLPLATEPDGDGLIYELIGSVSNGEISCNNDLPPGCLYSPDANFNGTDKLKFKVSDTKGQYIVAEQDIVVTPVNDPPLLTQGNIQVLNGLEDQVLVFNLNQGIDVDGDLLTCSHNGDNLNGDLVCDNCACVYTPGSNFFGEDFVTYKVSDGVFETSYVVQNINIEEVNDLPVYDNLLEVNALRNTTTNFLLPNAFDEDGINDSLTYEIVKYPSEGSLVCTQRNCNYTALINIGTFNFEYRVYDKSGSDGGIGTGQINVIRDNNAPELKQVDPISLVGAEDNNIDFQFIKSYDPDFDQTTTLIGEVNAQYGQVVCEALESNRCTYIPNENFNGSDSFTLKSFDGELYSEEEIQVSVLITPVNDAPVFNSTDIQYWINDNTRIEVSIPTAFDVDGDSLQYKLLNPTTLGVIDCINESTLGDISNCNYDSFVNSHGDEIMEVVAFDGELYTQAPVTVTVSITDVTPPELPIVSPNNFILGEKINLFDLLFDISDCSDGVEVFFSESIESPESSNPGWHNCTQVASNHVFNPRLTNQQGNRELYFFFRDVNGNINPTPVMNNFFYDSILPEITFLDIRELNSGAKHKININLDELNVNEDSDINLQISYNNGISWEDIASVKVGDRTGLTSFDHTIEIDLPNAVQAPLSALKAIVEDEAGNLAEVESLRFEIYHDTTIPEITIDSFEYNEVLAGEFPKEIFLTFHATDDRSGVSGYCLKNTSNTPLLTDKCWSLLDEPMRDKLINNLSWPLNYDSGETELYLFVRDYSGNVSNNSDLFIARDLITLDFLNLYPRVSSGKEHFCRITNEKLKCFGRNNLNQIGLESLYDDSRANENEIYQGVSFKSISSAGDGSCAVSNDNQLYCFGDNNLGQLNGKPAQPTIILPSTGPLAQEMRSVYKGVNSTIFFDVNDQAFAMGYQEFGNLGLSSDINQLDRITISGTLSGLGIIDLSINQDSTCFISKDFQIGCMGNNSNGQLGVISAPLLFSEPFSGLDLKFIDIESNGKDSYCAITTDRDLYCWGSNENQVLGLDDPAIKIEIPELVSGISPQKMSMNERMSCVILDDDSTHCWGLNYSNTIIPSYHHMDSHRDANVISLAVNNDQTCGSDRDNHDVIKCWGNQYLDNFNSTLDESNIFTLPTAKFEKILSNFPHSDITETSPLPGSKYSEYSFDLEIETGIDNFDVNCSISGTTGNCSYDSNTNKVTFETGPGNGEIKLSYIDNSKQTLAQDATLSFHAKEAPKLYCRTYGNLMFTTSSSRFPETNRTEYLLSKRSANGSNHFMWYALPDMSGFVWGEVFQNKTTPRYFSNPPVTGYTMDGYNFPLLDYSHPSMSKYNRNLNQTDMWVQNSIKKFNNADSMSAAKCNGSATSDRYGINYCGSDYSLFVKSEYDNRNRRYEHSFYEFEWQSFSLQDTYCSSSCPATTLHVGSMHPPTSTDFLICHGDWWTNGCTQMYLTSGGGCFTKFLDY
jgi:alpha-tubulin suppressor-like RCC1 family protein